MFLKSKYYLRNIFGLDYELKGSSLSIQVKSPDYNDASATTSYWPGSRYPVPWMVIFIIL
jgi:hypothetical protein